MTRILICGGRDYGKLIPSRVLEHPRRRAERARLREVLDGLLDEFGPFQMIHGGARGADALAGAWADDNNADGTPLLPEPLVFPALWNDLSFPDADVRAHRDGTKYDAKAGSRRNQKMIDEAKPDLVVAFPGGTGTEDMKARARAAKIEVREVE